MCGLAAGAGLGAAEAPTKLVTIGLSPFLVSLAMVAGVFVARWTVPTMMKGTDYVLLDLREKPHLIVWAVLAGMLWAVANTLTVFAIRDVGMSVAFPLWNTNSLVGVFWGWLFFNELRGAGTAGWTKVVGGAAAIVVGACCPAGHPHQSAGAARTRAWGLSPPIGAGLLWGTMYIPYRKAYISGMNPLSFVTVFTFGELGTTLGLRADLRGRPAGAPVGALRRAAGALLAVPGRILLGARRSVPAVRCEVHRHRPGHSALQHQSALGPGLGRARVRRIRRPRRDGPDDADCGVAR